MKYTITEIVDWEKDTREMDADYGHMSEGDIMRRELNEYEEKIENGKWPGLPFECEAEDEDEALEKYNDECCGGDYYKATEAEFADPDEFDPMTLRQLMAVSSADTMFRIRRMDDEIAVVLNGDFLADDEKVMEIVDPLLDCQVIEINVGVWEDPIAPKNQVPTMWVDIIEK